MPISNAKAKFNCSVQKVWNIVTSLTDYAWRSDLGKIEVVSENQFIEYTPNDNMKGHWTGVFSETGSETEIDFTEDVEAKKLMMKPFVKGYLKKQQAKYIDDLQQAVRKC